MSDFATVAVADGDAQGFDWILDGPDLETDDGLRTAVIVSLMTDRLAAADDVLPDGSGDRRGWWGDLAVDGSASDTAQPDLIGSRLWLLSRAKATVETAATARGYVLEALAWMIADGIAQSVQCTTSWTALGFLAISVTISRLGPNGTPVGNQFDFVWNPTLAGQG